MGPHKFVPNLQDLCAGFKTNLSTVTVFSVTKGS